MKLKTPKIFCVNFSAIKISRRRAVIFSCVFLFLVTPFTLFAKTLAKYREDVKNAKILTETLIYIDVEEMSPIEYSRYESNALSEIRASLPLREKIQQHDGADVEIDNRWLNDKLNEFEIQAKDSPKHKEILTEIGERLDAIEQKLNELDNFSLTNRTENENKRKLAEILSRDEYAKSQAPEESFFQKMWRNFLEWLFEHLPQPNMSDQTSNGFQSFSFILQMFLYALVLSAIGFLFYRFAPFFRGKIKLGEKKEKDERVILGERLAEDETAENLFNEAERLSRAGDWRGAIRKGYVALLCELSDRKIIGLARYKTNRDYLRDVRRESEIYENINDLTSNFERHWYGFASVGEKDWDEFKNGYKKTVSKIH